MVAKVLDPRSVDSDLAIVIKAKEADIPIATEDGGHSRVARGFQPPLKAFIDS
jgi:hypothetical protein